MKTFPKFAALVALIAMLSVSGCKIAASTPAPDATTPTAEVSFPFETQGSVADLATQTAIANMLLTATPEGVAAQPGDATATPDAPGVDVATNTPAPDVAVQPGVQTDQATATPAPVMPAGPTPVVIRPATYALQPGEFPYCIARRYNLDLPVFLAANGMTIDSKPAAGASLKIAATGKWNTTLYGPLSIKTHPGKYTVGSGESVYSIACKYGDVAPESILAANNLKNDTDVKAGMELNIP